MTKMYCIECIEEAHYIYKGNSYCGYHFAEAKKSFEEALRIQFSEAFKEAEKYKK